MSLNIKNEREEIQKGIWNIANGLRGAVDGWDFKNYVLGAMFYRYITENLTNYINEGEWKAGNEGFDYALLSDEEAEAAREGLVQEKGFFIMPSELFCNVQKKAENDKDLNETLANTFSNIERSAEGNFKGLFDDFDVNSNKLGNTVAKRNEKLRQLLDGVAAMDLGEGGVVIYTTESNIYEYRTHKYYAHPEPIEFWCADEILYLYSAAEEIRVSLDSDLSDEFCDRLWCNDKAQEMIDEYLRSKKRGYRKNHPSWEILKNRLSLMSKEN